MMKKIFVFFLSALVCQQGCRANGLSLDSCRAMALRNNKQLNVSKLKRDAARDTRRAVRTKYLPKIDAMGGYEYFSKDVSLLSRERKNALSNLGTSVMPGVSENASQIMSNLAQQGFITQEMAQKMGSMLESYSTPFAQGLNGIGKEIADAFETDSKSMWVGTVMLRQPLFMGGAIVAANKMADLNEILAENDEDAVRQATLYEIDQTYWTVVSLNQKLRLAKSYRDLVKKLSDDVKKMIKQGVATRADGLKVDVRVNEADMKITQAENGVALAKMLLCQLCGMPTDSKIALEDEDKLELADDNTEIEELDNKVGIENRPEIKMLQNAVDMSEEATKLIRAEYLPHVLFTGGYIVSNPNVLNGFQRKFGGMWNVGVTIQVPVWNWMESTYKIRASKTATLISRMEMSDAKEKIDLQISQNRFKLSEARKQLAMATKNLESANENLRCANLGFREGVMETTDVMSAQTAWEQAQSQKIDAEVNVKLATVGLEKALGLLE